MYRRQFLKQTALGVVGLEMALASPGQVQSQSTRPNFLVILTDDQTCRGVGYTNPLVQTPNLDRLAGEGLIFENTYVASPICVASRASLMTGVFPQQHGSVDLDTKGFHKTVLEEQRFQTLAQCLGANGYVTGFAGKSHLGPPREYGFTEGDEMKDLEDRDSFEWASTFLKKRAEDKKAFLLWLAPHQPHLPLLPGEEWLALYRDTRLQVDPNFRESPPEGSLYNQGLPGERYYRDSEHTRNYKGLRAGPPRSRDEILDFMRAYYATISHLDSQVGSLAETLKECGLEDNTVLIFLSDNGYHLGNHGLGNKITMHEESVRVPMFMRWSGLLHKASRCHELTSSLDLFPTLMELAGLSWPDWLEGKSLVPLFSNPDHAIREYVCSECVGVGGVSGMGHRMVRSRKWKYILTDVSEEALFDEEKDPYELNNLAALPENREMLQQMRNVMQDWMVHTGDRHEPPPEN